MTVNKLLSTPAHGSFVDDWDQPLNANFVNIDKAFGNYTTLNTTGLSGTIALTASMCVPLGFVMTGTPSGSIVYTTPAGVGGLWPIRNQATLGASITIGFASASGGSTVNIPAATNIAVSATGDSAGMVDIDTGAGSAAGSNTQIQVNVLGTLGGYSTFTFDGTTFHTPQLTVDGNAIIGSGAGSTLRINGTAIATPNGFNFNTGAFQMNAGGMLGIGTAPTAALLTIGGLLNITSGGLKWGNGLTQTTSQVLQISTTGTTASSTVAGIYNTTTGVAPTTAGGAAVAALAKSFTPQSSSSTLEIEIVVKGTTGGGGNDCFWLCLFRGSTLVDFAPWELFPGTGQMDTITLKTWLASPGTSAQAFTVRIGSNGGNAFYVNSTNNGTIIDQAGLTSWISIKELLAG